VRADHDDASRVGPEEHQLASREPTGHHGAARDLAPRGDPVPALGERRLVIGGRYMIPPPCE